MKRSKFSDEQILAIVKEGEAGRKLTDLCPPTGSPSRRTTGGRLSTAEWSSARCSD
jgi:hypothetical protein